MKKFAFILLSLCLSAQAFAGVSGTGWATVCRMKTKVQRQGNYKTTITYQVCKKEPLFNPIGVRLDAGVPDMFGASIIGRPLRFAQAELGFTETTVGAGVKVGASVFLPYWVSPGFHFQYGHQWFGNGNNFLENFTGSSPNISLLNHIEYDYLNLQGSLGFGHPNWFMFRIFAGYSYLWGQSSGLQTYVQQKTGHPSLTVAEAQAKVWSPSAKIAFDIYF